MSIQLNLEINVVQLLMSALGELPLKQGLDTWFKVRNQAEAQIQAQQAAAQAPAATAPEAPAQTMDVHPVD